MLCLTVYRAIPFDNFFQKDAVLIRAIPMDRFYKDSGLWVRSVVPFASGQVISITLNKIGLKEFPTAFGNQKAARDTFCVSAKNEIGM